MIAFRSTVVLICILAGGPTGEVVCEITKPASAGEHPVPDLERFLHAARPRVVITQLAVLTSSKPFTPSEFERYILASGPGAVMTIEDQRYATGLARLILDSRFKRSKWPTYSVDVLRRIEFCDGERVVSTLYVGLFGDLVHNNEVWEDTARRHWYRRVWEYLDAHVVASRARR